MLRFRLNITERNIIKKWHEITARKSKRHGGSEFIFPEESEILNKLSKVKNTHIEFSSYEIGIIFDWMDNALNPHPSQKLFLFPDEEPVYKKIISFIEKIKNEFEAQKNKKELDEKRSFAVKLADKLIWQRKEKKRLKELEKQEIEKTDKKIQIILKRIGHLKAEETNRKKRSIEEKIAASNKLKSDLDEIRKKLKF